MKNKFSVGQSVKYTFYGKAEQSRVTRIGKSGSVLFLENGRWMHAASCEPVTTPEQSGPDHFDMMIEDQMRDACGC